MNEKLIVDFIPIHQEAKIPTRATPGSLGYDIYACRYQKIKPFETVMVDTGLKMKLPEGYGAFLKPRSGLAVKNQIDLFAGTIDNDFLLEWKVVLTNFNVLGWLANVINKTLHIGLPTPGEFEIRPGDRIGQMVVIKQYDLEFNRVNEFKQGQREGGFGSTGN